MRVKKIVKQLLEMMDSENSKKKRNAKYLQNLISKLEKKEKILKNSIKESHSKKDRKKLENKIRLCIEHRKKGVKALKKISAR